MISRASRSSVTVALFASAFGCPAFWASSSAAQPADAPTAPPADAPPPAASTPAPSVSPAPPVAEPAPAPLPSEEKKEKGKGKHKHDHGHGHGSDASNAPDKSSKSPEIGGDKAPDEKAGKDDDKDKYGQLEIHGRVFARATLSTHDVAPTPGRPAVHVKALDLSLPSARIGFEYQSPLKWLGAEMEAELSGKPKVKDAYARVRKRYFSVKAGQFKVPISAIELEGTFSLPTVDRGLIHDLLTDVLLVGGRRIGVSVELHDRDADTGLRPTLTLGAFQGSTVDQDAVRDLEDETLGAQSYAARVELRPGDFTFGVSFEHRTGPEVVLRVPEGGTPALARPAVCESDACTTHYYTVGADAALDMEMSGTGLRLWLDGLAGRSWLESSRKRVGANALDGSFPVFGTARAVAAFRIGGMTRRAFYVEPYGMAGVLDPDLSYGRDHVTEWTLGVNVGRWKLARVGLEGDLYHGAARLPDDLGGDPDRMSLMLQGAVAF